MNTETRHQSPDDPKRLAPGPEFSPGRPVPGLSSWLLERKLGGGGFGEVWLARHEWDRSQAPRAVKFCTDPDAKHQLVNHERAVVLRVMRSAGHHPNIVPLLECNLDGAVPWLMYEYVEGGTLAAAAEQWRELPPGERLARAVRTLRGLAAGLAAVHRLDRPIVHRDLKPQNVLMAGAVPRITDFGIGGVAGRTEPAEATDAPTATTGRVPVLLQAAGTPNYAPTEQRLGSPPHPRDDVYALGVIAYQLLVGNLRRVPGPDAADELGALGVAPGLIALVTASTSSDPDRRPADAGAWAERLDGPAPAPARPPRGRRRLLAGAVALALVCVVALVAALGAPRDGTQNEAPADGGGPGVDTTSDPAPGATVAYPLAGAGAMTFCWVPAGEAQLGSPPTEAHRHASNEDAAPRGRFRTTGFWMGKYEVTQAEWQALTGEAPSFFQAAGGGAAAVAGLDTARFPVESVPWDRCRAAVATLNARGGAAAVFGRPGEFVLPHEDMWEYAARGGRGNQNPFYWGSELNGTQANVNGTFPYGGAPKGPALGRTTAVGGYETAVPHPWGLCDLHGNVWEWCDNLYPDTPTPFRVLRGGGYESQGQHCRAANRRRFAPDSVHEYIGLRLCFVPRP